MTVEKKKIQVGLVMPIAMIDNCGPEHWLEVKSIITEALSNHEKYQFETKLVSESDSVGLIHKRIVQGLHNSDIVICDVSCKNPNVMFELGMRLAFDKPTIIIKDDKTNYTFDAGGIEHVEYPRDLRFTKVVEFKNTLLRKTIATLEDSLRDPNHSPFLKSFGQFKVAKLDETEVMPIDLIIDKLNEMQSDVASLKSSQAYNRNKDTHQITPPVRFRLKKEIINAIEVGVINYLQRLEPGTRPNQKDLSTDIVLHLVEDPKIAQVQTTTIQDCVIEILNNIGYTA
ncbi:hypothetical protein [Brevibacillus sp. MER 51]|uniref:hypothetical protein n=1 Tax=Brevibacillus sp. MER 51 TaxID=2939560 RepID=UPI0020420C04|nr:hypothetical protein [Brevibacillus sp. MER 51]MCM3141324.1 hypothetical protein [Brevibacillus sp. MER 51]